MGFYERVIAMGDGVLKGEFMLNGFIVIRPESEVSKQLELLAHLDDADHVERYRAFEDWFKFTQDIPGAFYLWIVEHLFRDNELVGGTLEVGGERVDLGRIEAPLFLLGGADDHITPPEQVFAIADHAATPAKDVVRRVTSGGHLGLFMGTRGAARPLARDPHGRGGAVEAHEGEEAGDRAARDAAAQEGDPGAVGNCDTKGIGVSTLRCRRADPVGPRPSLGGDASCRSPARCSSTSTTWRAIPP